MLHCPRCRDELLLAIEYDRIEVDYCDGCRGVWLDAGEIELLFGNADAAGALLSVGSPAAPRGEERRRCPECDAFMTKEATASVPPVVFDHCPKGHGLWLDAGELETILEHRERPDGVSAVGAFLHRVFTRGE